MDEKYLKRKLVKLPLFGKWKFVKT